MADTAIDIRNLHKVYRLYDKPLYRLLDMFGLLFKKGCYSEHPALSDVNLKVERGEKVAIIGRNGAGKSTLLKIISNVLAPTGGEVEINGTVHALLSIGTGFHDDFTGRENIYAYLTSLGISGEEADRRAEEIIDFAEIDEFIDQPVSTYSTGMGVRLMFAASTAITPDILIVDEVLGVGDAYFVQKSIRHMCRLCADEGTTLLMVSHDIYTAAQICDRVIWIDRGRIFQDGPATVAIRAYEASIRLQEEARLRRRVLERRNARGRGGAAVYFQLVPNDRGTLHDGFTVRGIRLLSEGVVLDQMDMETGSSDSGGLILDAEDGNWGEAYDQNGRKVRDFMPYGSIYQRATFVMDVPVSATDVVLEIDADGPSVDSYRLEIYSLAFEPESHPFADCNGSLKIFPLSLKEAVGNNGGGTLCGVPESGHLRSAGQRLGNRRVRIENVVMLNAAGKEQLSFAPEEEARISFDITVLDDSYNEKSEIVIAVLKDAITPMTQWVFNDVAFKPKGMANRYSIRLPHMPFTPGSYTVSVGVFIDGYFDKKTNLHCAINPLVIDFYKHALEFQISSSRNRYENISFVYYSELIIDLESSHDDDADSI